LIDVPARQGIFPAELPTSAIGIEVDQRSGIVLTEAKVGWHKAAGRKASSEQTLV
jgi:hypothetical protein